MRSMRWLADTFRAHLRDCGRALFLLSRLRPRHLRALPLATIVTLSDWLFLTWRPRTRVPAPARLDWAPGISVVIPERGGVDLLGSCLAGLYAALAEITEPFEVIVVVNGSPPGDYVTLADRYLSVRWRHHRHALGFTRAVLDGVALARYGAIYLLNNDMRLEPAALRAALAWRAPHVFAIASQILFPEDGRRREETGWTFMPVIAGLPAPFHAIAPNELVRGTVWAGAGSALYQSDLLRQLLPGSLPFDPFYWEDVDLGVRAWRAGYESLYCPESRALHLHRVTVKKFYPQAEVERIFERNRLQFQLRNPFPRQPLLPMLLRLVTLDPLSLAEIGDWRACRNLWRARYF